jgi:hypothetical protein
MQSNSMSAHNCWIDLFTGTTWKESVEAGGDKSGIFEVKKETPEKTPVWSVKWRWAVFLCFSTILGFLLSRHIFWRDEVQAWQLAVYTDSISSLIHSLRYEGHPALWYLFLRGFGVFFDSPKGMLEAHWLLASLNAFLIIWFCPIPPWQRIACCFGYFMLFEYGVICRNYAMGTLLAFVFVIVHSRYKRAVIGPALLLALLVHTSLLGAFLAVSLLAYLIADFWDEGRASRVRLLTAIVVVGASVAAMTWYVKPPADSLWAKKYHKYRQQLTAKEVAANSLIFLRVIAPIPQPETLHFWNTNWTDSIAPDYIRKAIQYPAAAICLALAALSIIHRRTLIVLFSAGTLLLAGFTIIHGQTALRHQGQWFILLLLCYWIDRTHDNVGARDVGRWQQRIWRWFPAILFAIQPVAVIIPIARSSNAPFSATPALVKQVLEAGLDSSVWSAYPEFLVSPVSAASGRVVYSPQQDRFERHSVWNDFVGPHTRGGMDATPEMVASRLAAQVANSGESLVLFLYENEAPSILSELPQDIKVRQVATRPNGIIEDEANVSFLLQRTIRIHISSASSKER